jgi:phosphoglycerate dehydrogenase-like enzyme
MRHLEREQPMLDILCEVPLDPAGAAALAALPGVRVTHLPPHKGEWDLPAELLPGPEVILCRLPPGNLDALTKLKLVHICTVGYEHLRERNLQDRPFRVCNARGLFDTAIAEWSLAMMVNLVRDLRGMIRNQEHGVWDRGTAFHQEVRERVLGLWGYGGIGRETARLAKAFGMTVHALTRRGVGPRQDYYSLPGTGDPEGTLPDRVFTAGQEHDFLAGLDFLVLALPHTRHSGGMVGEAELKALPRRAFVLNPSRGPIIQEQALLRALRERWIAGAALDTHYAYPLPPDHPLWRFPNVILTPHISGSDRSTLFPRRMAELFRQNVERYRAGQPLLNEVTRQEWLEA